MFIIACLTVATVNGLEADATREQSRWTICLGVKVRRLIVYFNRIQCKKTV